MFILTKRFLVIFKGNERLIINDVINFKQRQIDEIKGIASCYEKDLLQSKKYGISLSYITKSQGISVLKAKYNIINSKTSQELKDQKIIQFGKHSLERILQRVGSNEDNVIITLLDKIKSTDTVTVAQFKGFPSLSYTLIENGDPDEYTFAISFILRKKSQFIKMVTVHLKTDEPQETEFRIGDFNKGYLEELTRLKRHLEEQSKKC